MRDHNLHTYTTPRLRHMLSAQQDSRDWKLSDLAQIMEIIGELEREIACREQMPEEGYGKMDTRLLEAMKDFNELQRKAEVRAVGIPERY